MSLFGDTKNEETLALQKQLDEAKAEIARLSEEKILARFESKFLAKTGDEDYSKIESIGGRKDYLLEAAYNYCASVENAFKESGSKQMGEFTPESPDNTEKKDLSKIKDKNAALEYVDKEYPQLEGRESILKVKELFPHLYEEDK